MGGIEKETEPFPVVVEIQFALTHQASFIQDLGALQDATRGPQYFVCLVSIPNSPSLSLDFSHVFYYKLHFFFLDN